MSTTKQMSDAEIAGHMGWKGPGAYSAAAMRRARTMINAAVATEREACAQVCESEICECCWDDEAKGAAEHLAETIRSRSTP